MIRKAAVMGYFYPEGLNNINNFIDSFKAVIPAAGKKIDAFGIISPHAGYVYSGKIAYEGYSSIFFAAKCKYNIVSNLLINT